MSLNSINKFLSHNTLWIVLSTAFMLILLSPLLFNGGEFYVPIFDNLDSTVVWYKILAHSGMIFADNAAILPNMMSGLPRSSYFSEFDIILWLYYFFEAQTAFIINEILIHIVAFFSMYIFLKRYIVEQKSYYQNVPIFIAALYFALLPYWSGAGLTIAISPLVTYSLLNIKNYKSTKWDWILLIFLPLYSSFIFFYMFYILFAGFYLLGISIKNHQINKALFLALFLMGSLFLLTQYRLIYTMFLDSGFISHRTEFDIFYTETFMDSYRAIQNFFLAGHPSHVSGLQYYYVLPLILIATFLSLSPKRFNKNESMLIWLLIIISFVIDIWSLVLKELYSMPIIITFFIYTTVFSKKYKILSLLMLFQISIIFVGILQTYEGFSFLAETFPLLKALNIARITFIQSLINTILLAYAIQILYRKLYFSHIFMAMFIFLQFLLSMEKSFYQSEEKTKYASFEQYYAPSLFEKVKNKIPESLENIRIVSYGLEPAVTLFNNFYTIDGYSVNYPLAYKHKFRKVIAHYLDEKHRTIAKEVYDKWGGKVYILTTVVTLAYYNKKLTVYHPQFQTEGLCALNTNYILSSHKIDIEENTKLHYIDSVKGAENSWDIFIYKFQCNL